MERKELEQSNIANAKIKFNGIRLDVKPFISTFETMAIIDACLKALEEDYQLYKLPLIKTMFNMAVVTTCTDLLVDGVSLNKGDGNIDFQFDIDAKKVEKFEGFYSLNTSIFGAIKNYKETYESLLKAIEFNNVGKSISEMIFKMPNFEEMDKNLESAINKLKNLEEEKPELVKKVISHGISEDIKESAREDLKKSKSTKKKTSTTKKESK